MNKLHQVVMLSTEKANKIGEFSLVKYTDIDGEKLVCGIKVNEQTNIKEENQHLYIISDEEIKEGDYVYDNVEKRIIINQYKTQINKQRFKVIASTDKSLHIDITKEFETRYTNTILPQIPESFIKAYIEAQGNIKEVMVEYENELNADYPHKSNREYNQGKLKLRPDNTVIIHQAKTYTREEVKQLCFQAYINFACIDGKVSPAIVERELPNFNKWIEENL